jgi:hypothetical protein
MSIRVIPLGIDPMRLQTVTRDPRSFVEDLEEDEPAWFARADRSYFSSEEGYSARMACALMTGERHGEHPRFEGSFLRLVSQHVGQRLESGSWRDQDDELLLLLSRWLQLVDAPERLAMETLVHGQSFIAGLVAAGGWFEPEEVDEVDGFFLELDEEMRQEALEELDLWDPSLLRKACNELEGWFSECSSRGWGLMLFASYGDE